MNPVKTKTGYRAPAREIRVQPVPHPRRESDWLPRSSGRARSALPRGQRHLCCASGPRASARPSGAGPWRAGTARGERPPRAALHAPRFCSRRWACAPSLCRAACASAVSSSRADSRGGAAGAGPRPRGEHLALRRRDCSELRAPPRWAPFSLQQPDGAVVSPGRKLGVFLP